MLSKSNFTFLWLKCLWNEFFPLLFVTGKYANLRICIKILLKKTQSIRKSLFQLLNNNNNNNNLFNHVSPRSFYKLVQNVNVKGLETSSDVNTFTNVIKRYCSQQTTGTLQRYLRHKLLCTYFRPRGICRIRFIMFDWDFVVVKRRDIKF